MIVLVLEHEVDWRQFWKHNCKRRDLTLLIGFYILLYIWKYEFFHCKSEVVQAKRLIRDERTIIAIIFVGRERAFLAILHKIVFSVSSFAVLVFWPFSARSWTSRIHPVGLGSCNTNS